MKFPRFLRFAIPVMLLAAALACNDDDSVTGSGGALARLSINGPDSAASGQAFDMDLIALNVGVTNIANGVVAATFPAPLFVNSVTASAGTTATFTNGVSGASVTWTLNTLDSNTQSTLRVNATGTIPQGGATSTVTVQATMTATGIQPGDAVVSKALQINP